MIDTIKLYFRIKYLVLGYFFSFLLLDLLNGLFLQYLKIDLPISPGQIIRGSLSLILIIELLIKRSINNQSKYIFYFILFVPAAILLYFIRDGIIESIPIEIISIFKPLFFLLLFYKVYIHYKYFIKWSDKIILFNLLIFSFAIHLSFLSGVGINPYESYYAANKSFFYGSNPTAILGFCFCIYYTYQLKENRRNLIFLALAISALFFSGSKIILFYPFFLLYFMTLRTTKTLAIKILSILIICLVCFLFVLGQLKYDIILNNQFSRKYTSRVLHSVDFFTDREAINFAPLRLYSYVSGLRSLRANTGLTNIINDFESLSFGYGHAMRSEKVGESYFGDSASEMDIIDIFLSYGIIGLLLIYIPIFKVLQASISKLDTDRNPMLLYFLFIYSSFAGHVITSPMGSTIFALFLGIEYGKQCTENYKRYIFDTTLKNPKLIL